MKKVLSGLALVLAAGVLVSIAVADFPRPLAPAEETLAGWLNGLRGKSISQIEADLGPPIERSTWTFQGANPPIWRYKTPGGGKVDIYFFEGKALNMSYQMMSQ